MHIVNIADLARIRSECFLLVCFPQRRMMWDRKLLFNFSRVLWGLQPSSQQGRFKVLGCCTPDIEKAYCLRQIYPLSREPTKGMFLTTVGESITQSVRTLSFVNRHFTPWHYPWKLSMNIRVSKVILIKNWNLHNSASTLPVQAINKMAGFTFSTN